MGVVKSLPVDSVDCQHDVLADGEWPLPNCFRARHSPFLPRLASGSCSAGGLSASSRIHGRLTCFSLTLTSCSSGSRPLGSDECGGSEDTSLRPIEEWLKSRTAVKLVRHDGIFDDPLVTQREVEM